MDLRVRMFISELIACIMHNHSTLPELRLISRNLQLMNGPVVEAIINITQKSVKLTVIKEKMNAHLP